MIPDQWNEYPTRVYGSITSKPSATDILAHPKSHFTLGLMARGDSPRCAIFPPTVCSRRIVGPVIEDQSLKLALWQPWSVEDFF